VDRRRCRRACARRSRDLGVGDVEPRNSSPGAVGHHTAHADGPATAYAHYYADADTYALPYTHAHVSASTDGDGDGSSPTTETGAVQPPAPTRAGQNDDRADAARSGAEAAADPAVSAQAIGDTGTEFHTEATRFPGGAAVTDFGTSAVTAVVLPAPLSAGAADATRNLGFSTAGGATAATDVTVPVTDVTIPVADVTVPVTDAASPVTDVTAITAAPASTVHTAGAATDVTGARAHVTTTGPEVTAADVTKAHTASGATQAHRAAEIAAILTAT
jgi:hypothetical protein